MVKMGSKSRLSRALFVTFAPPFFKKPLIQSSCFSMKILFVHHALVTTDTYDDAVRALCGLAKALVSMGHEVTILAKKGSLIIVMVAALQ